MLKTDKQKNLSSLTNSDCVAYCKTAIQNDTENKRVIPNGVLPRNLSVVKRGQASHLVSVPSNSDRQAGRFDK